MFGYHWGQCCFNVWKFSLKRGKVPSNSVKVTILGAQIDLTWGLVFPTQERIHNLLLCCSHFVTVGQASAIAWLWLLGLMASVISYCGLCMRLLQLHLLPFYRPKLHLLSLQAPVHPLVCSHILWWCTHQNLNLGLVFSPSTKCNSYNRCIKPRLGSLHGGRLSSGCLVPSRTTPTHQCLGTPGSAQGSHLFSEKHTGPGGPDLFRQFDSFVIHK